MSEISAKEIERLQAVEAAAAELCRVYRTSVDVGPRLDGDPTREGRAWSALRAAFEGSALDVFANRSLASGRDSKLTHRR